MSALRHHVVITSLQEDLKRIGLTSVREQEDSDEEPAPEVDAEGGNPMEQDMDDEPDDTAAMGEEEGDEEDDDEEEPDMAAEARTLVKTRAQHFLKAHVPVTPRPVGMATERRGTKGRSISESRKPAGKPKPFRKPLKESRSRRLHRLAEGKIFNTAPMRKRTGVSRVDALLEEVAGIVGDLHRTKQVEKIIGFANISVIAEMLNRRFRAIGMSLSEGSIYRVAGQMQKLSEQAADMALGMDGGEEPPMEADPAMGEPEPPSMEQDDPQVDALFKKFMAKLLDALQLYNDVSGKSEEDPMPGEEEPEEPEAEGFDAAEPVDDEEEPEDEPVAADAEGEDDEDDDEDDEPVAEEDEDAAQVKGPYGSDVESDDDIEKPMTATEQVRRILGLGEARARRVENTRARRVEGKGKKGKKKPLKSSKNPNMRETKSKTKKK
jgi:hypothetical protein